MVKNTMGAREYIRLNVLWLVVGIIWYKRLLFKQLPNCTYFDSLVILWTAIILFSVISFFVIFERARNGLSITASVLIPLEIYTVFAYYKFFPILFTVVLSVAAALIVLYSILILNKRIPNNRKRRIIIRRRINKWLCCSRIIAALTLSVLILPLAAKTVFNVPLLSSNIKIKNEIENNSYTIKNNIDELKKLQDSEWQKLSVQEKLNVLQIVANIEGRVLGISTELCVGAKSMPDYVIGQYVVNTDKIYINIDKVDKCDAEETLNTICHESYHAYQAKMADVYNNLSENDKKLKLFKDARKYAENYENYHSSGPKYYDQPLETDAREYAEDAVDDYYSKIEYYLEGDYSEEMEDDDWDQLIKDAAKYLNSE